MTEEQARILFDEKMAWVQQQTRRNIEVQLEMAGGPEFAKQTYRQMFLLFWSGIDTGMKLNS